LGAGVWCFAAQPRPRIPCCRNQESWPRPGPGTRLPMLLHLIEVALAARADEAARVRLGNFGTQAADSRKPMRAQIGGQKPAKSCFSAADRRQAGQARYCASNGGAGGRDLHRSASRALREEIDEAGDHRCGSRTMIRMSEAHSRIPATLPGIPALPVSTRRRAGRATLCGRPHRFRHKERANASILQHGRKFRL